MDRTLKTASNFVAVKDIDKDGVLSAVASNAAIDRDGESIEPDAFEASLETYRKNPVILANHTHVTFDGSPSIIGSARRIEVRDSQLEFDMKFASTPLGKTWQTLFDEGHAKAFSVGFIPVKGVTKKNNDQSVYTHTEVELLEISAVSVPSNREALSRSKGFNNAIKEILENHESELLEKIAGRFDDVIAELKDYLGTLIVTDDSKYYEGMVDTSAEDEAAYNEKVLTGILEVVKGT